MKNVLTILTSRACAERNDFTEHSYMMIDLNLENNTNSFAAI